MSEPTPRGSAAGRTAPAGRAASPAGRGGAATGKPNARRAIRKPVIDIDRIVLLRVAFVLVVLAFLYLVVWIGMRAFGAGGAKQVKRIDRVIIDATTAAPVPVPQTDPAKPGTSSP